jgi:hypothetical protein
MRIEIIDIHKLAVIIFYYDICLYFKVEKTMQHYTHYFIFSMMKLVVLSI